MKIVCLLMIILTVFITVNGKPSNYIQDGNNYFKPKAAPTKCGYDSCHPVKPDMLNVHIVAHTHDDVGWLKTVDQYYFGSRSNIQQAGVKYILDSVIAELWKDPSKRFIYVETAYLWKWWKTQHDSLRHKVKKLVNEGRLEFIGGAWSMNDEATTHYQSIIDQFAWGLRKLNETFGECGRPKIGWQIDPFGHSREMASIFAQLGFDGLLIGRLDYQDKVERLTTKTAEMIWQGSANLGNASELFTSILFNNYAPPPGFCFDILCGNDPIIDDKHSTEYNVDAKVEDLLSYAKSQAAHYQSNNIIFTMGEDFQYSDAPLWFDNIDKLICHANALQSNGSKINLIYSTPSCYLKAVHDEDKTKKWPVKTDDFFPYASDPNTYWTGYFTSRPTLKRFERLGNNFLQVCKQLYALTDLGPEDWVDLNAMREAMGVMQHHDAITGTEKEHVANDYARILTAGIKECEIAATTALNKIMTSKPQTQEDVPKIKLESCLLLNISQCEVTEKSKTMVVTLYNPLSRLVSQYVRLPVTGKSYTVTDPCGMDLSVQLVPIPEPVLNIPGRNSEATVELVFHASGLPPLGFKSYYIKEGSVGDMTLREVVGEERNNLHSGDIRVTLDEKSGLVSHIKVKDADIPISQDFLWYEGMAGDNAEFKNRSSGAYIFRPASTGPKIISTNVTTKMYKGALSQEIHQTFNEWCSQVIRLYAQENYIEYEWLVGPIPVEDALGKEIITRYTTPLKSYDTFYTDSNGRELLKRVRNYRPTWNVNISEPVAANYYPVTSQIAILDEKDGTQVVVLTDRAQGGSSLKQGDLELMVHRRLLHDDAFGVGEALNETAFKKGLVARGQHYLIGGNKERNPSVAALARDVAQRKILAAWTFISSVDNMSYQQYKSQYVMEYAGLKQSLPKNVQILTLEPWKAASFLLRLEHVLEKNEDAELSKPATVNIKNLFAPFSVKSVRETTLGGNQWLDKNIRLKWSSGERLDDQVRNDYLPDGLNSAESNQEKSTLIKRMEEVNMVVMRNDPKDTNEIPKDINDNDSIEEFYRKLQRDNDVSDDFELTLQPMQIRTLVIDIEKM